MKVFGFDDTGPHRGDLLAAQVDKIYADHFGMEFIASDLGWEYAATSFKQAKTELIRQMKEVQADPELIQGVRECKASHIPEEG